MPRPLRNTVTGTATLTDFTHVVPTQARFDVPLVTTGVPASKPVLPTIGLGQPLARQALTLSLMPTRPGEGLDPVTLAVAGTPRAATHAAKLTGGLFRPVSTPTKTSPTLPICW